MQIRSAALACASFALWLCASANAATYFVSPDGDDAAAGTSERTAWRTPQRAELQGLLPGDAVLFERGGEWLTQLIPSADGEAHDPIVYGAYGVGPKPRFIGSDELVPSAFTPGPNGTFKIALAAAPHAVIVDGVFFVARTSVTDCVATPDSWYWDPAGTLHLNTGGSDPRTDGRHYRVCNREDLVAVLYRKHVVLRDLVAEDSANLNGGYAFRVEGSDDVRLERCDAYRAGKHHFGVINSKNVVADHLYASLSMPELGFGGASAFVAYSDAAHPGSTSEWKSCTAENPGGPYPAFYTHGPGILSVVLRELRVNGTDVTIGTDTPETRVRIEGGELDDGCLTLYGNDIVVDGLTVRGRYACVDVWGQRNVLQNLLMTGMSPQDRGYRSAVIVRGQQNVLRFSTIVMGDDADPVNTCLALTTSGTQTECYGNVLSAPRRAVIQWGSAATAADLGRFDFNLYGDNATFGSKDLPFDAWRDGGFDLASQRASNPFLNPDAGDYRLRGDAGVDAVWLDGGIPQTDHDGMPRLVGPAPDMGAFETQPPIEEGAGLDAGALDAGLSDEVDASIPDAGISAEPAPEAAKGCSCGITDGSGWLAVALAAVLCSRLRRRSTPRAQRID